MPPFLLCLLVNMNNTNGANYVTKICQILLMVSVAYGQGRIHRSRIRDMHPPPAIFKNVFDAYNFSII